ncbi:hypothetical protein Tco_0333353, partial [Tanacetum coccineum]
CWWCEGVDRDGGYGDRRAAVGTAEAKAWWQRRSAIDRVKEMANGSGGGVLMVVCGEDGGIGGGVVVGWHGGGGQRRWEWGR